MVIPFMRFAGAATVRRVLPDAAHQRLTSVVTASGRAASLLKKGRAVEAIRIYARVARKGDREAQFRVGCCYLEGLGVPTSRVEGVRWLERAARQGHVDAAVLLASLLLQGGGGGRDATSETNRPTTLFDCGSESPDFEAAAGWARRAAAQGSPEGQAILAHILSSGPTAMRDSDSALFWYQRAAAGRSPNGMFGYALSLACRADSAAEWQTVADFIRGAAEGGHVTAARVLGQLYARGTGVARDLDEAARWLQVAAAAGDGTAHADLANLVLAGAGSSETSAMVRKWFAGAAIAGDPVAQFNFGICLAEGIGGERDDARALIWLRDAADKLANAQYWYGQMLAAGRGTDANPEEGRSWIARAAAAGMVEAQAVLSNSTITTLALSMS